jgi:hypothetical protein
LNRRILLEINGFLLPFTIIKSDNDVVYTLAIFNRQVMTLKTEVQMTEKKRPKKVWPNDSNGQKRKFGQNF